MSDPMTNKPTLCLDFDGVIHSYTSGWKGAENIMDPPTPGAMEFIWNAQRYFTVVIYSSRSISSDGLWAMKKWLAEHMRDWAAVVGLDADSILSEIEWANKKPAAFLTIDDRAMLFTGTWPDPQELLKFKPWNKR